MNLFESQKRNLSYKLYFSQYGQIESELKESNKLILCDLVAKLNNGR